MSEKRPYAVTIQQHCTTTIWVLAEDRPTAEMDAMELTPGADWDVYDLDLVDVMEGHPPPGTSVWSGGPDGEDITWPQDR